MSETNYGPASGKMLHVPDVAHMCRPPDILKFGENSVVGVPTVSMIYPPGSLWMCECGIVWVVRFLPGMKYGMGFKFGGSVWDRETRREKRRRLGLRWWMRSPSHE